MEGLVTSLLVELRIGLTITLNSNGEQLIQFCAHNELRINNTFYPHKQQHKYTFENTRGHKSIIDYIITNRNIHPSKILDVRTLTSANTGTNHHMVLAIMRNCVQKKTHNKPKVTEKLNIESLSDDTTKYLYQQRLRKAINENKILKDDTVELAWKRLSTDIRTAAEEALGKRKVNLNGKPNTKPWFTHEIKSPAEEKRKSYLQYISQTITYADYKVVRNKTNMEIQTIKRQFWEKYSSDMENDLYGGQKKIWNMIRDIKRPINEYIHTKTITLKEWERYFHELYGDTVTSQPTEQKQENISGEGEDIQQQLISKDKSEATMRKMKNRKSPGLDNINNELLKYGGNELIDQMHVMFNKIYDQRKVLEEWKVSISIPVFKKEKKDPNNYRGISLLSTTSKLLINIITEEISSSGMSEEQQGFRQN
ncbi:uncharacterized protein LOC130903737 [Diorhabda carinulata]|uniref:uncharacterized protein LOC130903737 n=1 Tax=Diorhabda carinulata TaxID=1163345 RepID=UPI0025A173E0|nr:uncharacterized protein LOC130903737 [Diorhabda carinulata]